MARVNVYLPDELAEQVRAADLNVSQISQEALRAALSARQVDAWLDELAALPPTNVSAAAADEAVAAAKDELGDG